VEAELVQPVHLDVDGEYVVSRTAPAGIEHVRADESSGGRTAGPLETTDGSAVTGPGGSYPDEELVDDPWMDVVVVTEAPAGIETDDVAPSVTAGSIAGTPGGATEAVLVFSEPVVGLAATVDLPDGRSVPIPAGGTAEDLTVRLTVPSGLPAGTYLVTITGARDRAGNVMTVPWTWAATLGS
jgi:hypothetical protein